jgi:hypothetical protein
MATDINKKQTLVEMAAVCHEADDFGFIGIVYSNDRNPPLIHIYNLDKEELGQIHLISDAPQSESDIKTYEGNVDSVKKNIVEWANSKHSRNSKITNWKSSLLIWDAYQED